ncbi:MAG: tetratricopeptide repeat protein [Clostridiales bacterium]|nr:tetratricopeptide repeat protein [Clostridiales bacterium]
MRDLYERFKQDLVKRESEMYYDEDDLIMIYDLAGDLYDRYVQLEVLMLGRKLFPASDQLELRAGIAMLDMYDEADLSVFLERNKHCRGLLWEILRVRGSINTDDQAIAQFDRLLEEYSLNEDEEIIQFVKMVNSYECYEWLEAHHREFVERSRYRDTALSECAEALRYFNPELSEKLIEELTRIDPFNADAWIKQAEIYRENGNTAEGLAAIEYAKALRPDDFLPLYVEATLVTSKNPASSKAAELLQRVLQLNPDMMQAKIALSDIYEHQNRGDLSLLLWEEELRRDPDSAIARERIEFSRCVGKGEIPPEWFGMKQTEEELAQYIEESVSKGQMDHEVLATVLEAYDRVHGLYQLAGDYIKLLYGMGRLDGIVSFMEKERVEGCPELRLDPPALPLYAAAKLRLGFYKEAEIIAMEYLDKAARVCQSVELSMAFAGVKISLDYIIDQARRGDYSKDRDPVAESLGLK